MYSKIINIFSLISVLSLEGKEMTINGWLYNMTNTKIEVFRNLNGGIEWVIQKNNSIAGDV